MYTIVMNNKNLSGIFKRHLVLNITLSRLICRPTQPHPPLHQKGYMKE